MKKIIFSLMAIAVIGSLIGTGTFAWFNDTETSAGNTFVTGTLNLQVGSANPMTDKVTLSNIKSADAGSAAIWLTKNLGTISGTLDAAIGTITNNENGRSEVEIAAGDTTDNAGELGGLLKIALWMDVDKSAGWTSGDYYLKSDGTKVAWASGAALPAGAYDIVNNFGGKSWTSLQTAAASSDAGNFRIEYNFPDGGSSDYVVQGDSCIFDITFALNQ
jgi:predicted ribosomally synthesized peptide with SipW-like signal peptide